MLEVAFIAIVAVLLMYELPIYYITYKLYKN